MFAVSLIEGDETDMLSIPKCGMFGLRRKLLVRRPTGFIGHGPILLID
jgi:hypothetical protein